MKSPTRAALILIGVMAAFFGYLQMAKTMPINADGAGNALQAWEMWHGNPLMRGWTATDVPFYSTELVQYALIEMVHGLNEEVFRIAAAMTYALLVLMAALVAKGSATGRQALVRMGIAVAIILLPMPGAGYLVAFGGPNHLGTGVPLLLTWLVLDRSQHKRWAPVAIALLLAWAQVGDPLVLFIGALPLGLVGAYRALRSKDWKGRDTQFVLAAIASVVLGQLILKAIAAAGGFVAHKPPTDFASPDKWLPHFKLLGEVLSVNYGGYLPDASNPVDFAVSLLRLLGLALALAAVVVTLVSLLRKPLEDRVNQILGVAIVINLAAFIASTLPTDLMSARQVVTILPMGAALAGRVWGPWLAPSSTPAAEDTARPAAGWRNRQTIATAALAVILVFFGAVFIGHSLGKPYQEPKRDLVAWLDSQGLKHGIGGYWNSSDLTLIAQGKIVVAPVTGGSQIRAYHWESKNDWYDPALHDARFIVIDTTRPSLGTIETTLKQFGQPVQRRDFAQFAVLVYDRNLLKELG